MNRPPRLRRWLAAALALGAVGPFVAEQRAQATVRAGWAGNPDAPRGGLNGLDLDAGGLHVLHPWRTALGRTFRARRVTVRPSWSGLAIDVHGLHHDAASASEAPDAGSGSQPGPPSPSPDPVAPPRIDTHGLRVEVIVHGDVSIPTAVGDAIARDVTLTVEHDGSVHARGSGQWDLAGHTVASDGAFEAVPLSSRPPRARVTGRISIDGSTEVLPLAGELSAERVQLVLGTSASGLKLEARRFPADETTTLTANANGFSVGPLQGLLSAFPGGHLLDPHAAVTLDGQLELSLGRDTRAHVRGLEIRGMTLHHRKLARQPVALQPLVVDGDAWWRDSDHFDGQLTIGHADISAVVAGSRRDDAIEASVELAEIGCQRFAESIPEALTEQVRGTRLDGVIDGRLAVALSLAEIERIKGLSPDQIDPLDPPHPGTLDLDFDFLSRCAVVDDAPGIDLRGLDGPYRHRFVDGRGRLRQRIMAPGAQGFVALDQVRRIADAFVVLEDTRFEQHDGFDRPQMHNALWHNLVEGRIARGASTISQQTARNLFLGIDRSLGRKLQEAFLTARLESALSKDRILELYVNVIELAPGVHGVEDAARYYFGKSATDLSVLEALHLASLAPAPHTYAERFASGEVDRAWMQQLRDQAHRMWQHRKITRAEFEHARRSTLRLVAHAQPVVP